MDRLQTEGEELETLLQQPFKIKNMLTGKALRMNWRAGGFEEQAVKLNDKTKVSRLIIVSYHND